MKRRSERVRLQRLSVVGEATSVDKADLQNTELQSSDTKVVDLPIEVAKPRIADTKVEKPRVEKPVQTLPKTIRILLILLTSALFLVTLACNASFTYDRASNPNYKLLLACLGGLFESILFLLPTLAIFLWQGKIIQKCCSVFVWITGIPLLAIVLLSSLGFASTNLSESNAGKVEHDPTVIAAKAGLDAAVVVAKQECVKLGPVCRQRQDEEIKARQAVTEATNNVRAAADSMATAVSTVVSWVSAGRYKPTPDDIATIWLILIAVSPQLCGIVLALSLRA